MNISNQNNKNTKILGFSDREANYDISELSKLIIAPFSNIKFICPQEICLEFDFMNYCFLISDLELNAYKFQNISRIAMIFWPISASEIGAGSAFFKNQMWISRKKK